MSFPNPNFDILNEKMAITRANTTAITHIASSSQKFLPDIHTRMMTAIKAAPPVVPEIMGVMCVMSRTSAPHMVWVTFCAAK